MQLNPSNPWPHRDSTLTLPANLPLLDYDFWRTELCNGDLEVYKSAAGLVLSYVAKRYEYGELRIHRLNMIYRFAPEMSLRHLLRGYLYGYNQYSAFFGRNIAWAAVAVLYIGLVLTAMQTALAVNPTKENTQFQQAMYGFSVSSMVSVLFFSVLALTYFIFAFMMNLVFTRRKVKEQSKQRENQKATLASSLDTRVDTATSRGGEYGNALLAATYRGHNDIVKLLLANGADVNVKDDDFGQTPLSLPDEHGYSHNVKLPSGMNQVDVDN
ncbi:hypothetical protein Micbo1qcDRAFT_226865 [Microdochium bolleyi]|uniref:Uncharacterized protein n=1 Tax=Microdochium bolleyi TaxID=196109 RepID=A0A136IIJ8_9PEZI|nr:hypothetical protein Micbo1qcDRAFT_226865 [Microdochium bolleyi]